MIDNYDSFVHNLARYFEQCDAPCAIHRNDQITISDIKDIEPEAIILSPGPCTPEEAGICIEAIKEFGKTTPILGVCLGHQAICDAYGGQTKQSDAPIHGKSSTINHNKKGIFKNIPTPLNVGRYHSLICELEDETVLEKTATLDDQTIMGIVHKTHPVYGVQFHPESILTQHGLDIIQNFVDIATTWNKAKAA
ncbi:MAG: aminodeoxychorismate/anthranilate synthase component II [Bdellovibrionales bacterium]